MPTQSQGWAFVSASVASGTPGGANTNIQFNDAGAFGGSSDLTWDGSTVTTTDISASLHISASAFYGDGSNLTNLPGIFTELDSSNAYTTSSLSVGSSAAPGATLHVSSSGDGALFRVDGLTETGPVLFATGSGRVGIGIADPAVALEIDGHITFGTGTGGGYLANRGSETTRLRFGADGATSIALECGGVQLLLADNDSPDKIVLGAAADNNIIVTGSLIVNGSISGSSAISASTFYGSGLIDSRLAIIGPSGIIEDNEQFSYTLSRLPQNFGFNGLNISSSASGSSFLGDGVIAITDSSEIDVFSASPFGIVLDVETAASKTISISGSTDVGLALNSTFSGGASLIASGNIFAGHTGAGTHTAHMNSDGEISGSGDLITGADLIMGASGVAFFAGAGSSTKISANGGMNLNLMAPTLVTNAGTFQPDTDNGTDLGSATKRFSNFYAAGSVSIGVPSGTPKLALDVHYTGSSLRPENLSNNTGGGEVIYYGTSSANLTSGGLYYLNSDGGWQSADSSLTGSGHEQFLGIAMGTGAPEAVGVLVKGYFHQANFYSGSFIKGAPVYIQSSSVARSATEGGYMSSSAPSAVDSYVRIVGYGTDTANIIYFNPDSTYVEIGS